MKKILAPLLALIFALSLTSCGGNTEEGGNDTPVTPDNNIDNNIDNNVEDNSGNDGSEEVIPSDDGGEAYVEPQLDGSTDEDLEVEVEINE